jgi:hypothetical protein
MPCSSVMCCCGLLLLQVRGSMPGQLCGGASDGADARVPLAVQMQAMPRLGFAYTRNAIILPSQQPGQLTFYDVVLWGLPQGGTPSDIAAESGSGMMPPEAWTVLLWSVNRCVQPQAVCCRRRIGLLLQQP